ncbi:MAG: MSEP-CTERM sorting domain-containing protein [Flectobacillus sp.]|uniref:MSEP-CTERM sorting domain-containing protein n=1 Tax=Flectobacillus sp. TaxID=50419 RepID=UPI003B9D6D1B
MKNLLKPYWVLLTGTLPISVLLYLLLIEWKTIHSLLSSKTLVFWNLVFGVLLTLLLIQSIYAVFQLFLKKNVSLSYALCTLSLHLLSLIFYTNYSDEIVPANVPAWMFDGNKFIYIYTFLMPSIMYALMVLILVNTPDVTKVSFLKNLGYSFAIPIGFYFFFFMIGSVYHPVHLGDYLEIFLWIIFVTIMMSFYYFALRALYILIFDKGLVKRISPLIWKLIFALIFPILGLSLYATIMTFGGLLGDFTNFWFFILALINGIIVCLPRYTNQRINLIIWLMRSCTFSYTTYFFVVFLPYTPLSFLLLFTVVFGVLMLTPIALFFIHASVLYSDYMSLKLYFKPYDLIMSGLVSFLLIPAIITIHFQFIRHDLHQTLDYVYSPSYEQQPNISNSNIKKLISYFRKTKRVRASNFQWIPYIDSYFSWLVMDNLSLSNRKLNELEQIFLGAPIYSLDSAALKSNVALQDLKSESVYDEVNKVWKSWVHLSLKNGKIAATEYHGEFSLPTGVFITNYYLDMGGRREMGILAEKKTAKWVYQNIVNTSKTRDPGILYYSNFNKIELRVYPFVANELRTTGFQVVHKEPFQLKIGDKVANLGTQDKAGFIENSNFYTYIPSKEKAKLPEFSRKPYFHFVIDVSNLNSLERYKIQLKNLENKYPSLFINAKISLTDAYVKTVDYKKNWTDELSENKNGSGFFLQRAIEQIGYQESQNQSNFYPIILVLSDSTSGKIFTQEHLSAWSFAFPEEAGYFYLDEHNILKKYVFDKPFNGIVANLDSIVTGKKVKVWLTEGRKYFLQNDFNASLIFKTNLLQEPLQFKKENWQSGIWLLGQQQQLLLHPELKEQFWRNFLKNSFESNILTEMNTFIALENEAQKAVLKRKQHEVMNANTNLDISQDMNRMSEPEFWMMALSLVLLGIYSQRKDLTSRFWAKNSE